ncbi:Dhx36, partial [Symbiodinium sp. KB8]
MRVGFNRHCRRPPSRKLWSYPLTDENRRCFAGYIPCLLKEEVCESFFKKIRDSVDWQQPEGPLGQIPRKTCWMVKAGCDCKYRYGGIEVAPQKFPSWMNELMELVLKPCGLSQKDWPNSCNLNLYEDGGMTVGWHADDEKLFQGRFRDCRIISLSLGATRKFELRLNWPEEEEAQITRLTLRGGDLLTMEALIRASDQPDLALGKEAFTRVPFRGIVLSLKMGLEKGADAAIPRVLRKRPSFVSFAWLKPWEVSDSSEIHCSVTGASLLVSSERAAVFVESLGVSAKRCASAADFESRLEPQPEAGAKRGDSGQKSMLVEALPAAFSAFHPVFRLSSYAMRAERLMAELWE